MNPGSSIYLGAETTISELAAVVIKRTLLAYSTCQSVRLASSVVYQRSLKQCVKTKCFIKKKYSQCWHAQESLQYSGIEPSNVLSPDTQHCSQLLNGLVTLRSRVWHYIHAQTSLQNECIVKQCLWWDRASHVYSAHAMHGKY